jgi:hypothetical protein
MDVLVVALIVIVVAVAFYLGVRAYTRRQMSQGGRPPDVD